MRYGLPDPISLLGKFNPFGIAGDVAGKVAADSWTGIMLSLWSAGLWVLQFALSVMDQWMTPDISAHGPAAEVYRTTFWGAGALVLIMALVQLGVAAFRRDGKSLARVLIGAAQFAVVWGAWIAYGIAVIAACGGLARAMMHGLLNIDTWAQWQPMPNYDFAKGGIQVGLATVLGILGLFLWVAAIGHFVVMLTRAAALLVLTAVTPIAAAGLVSEAGRGWFWKSLRWFHAAAFTPVLTVLVMGLGVKLSSGVAQGGTQTAQAAIGTAFPGVMLILISVVAPVALFKLLAFVDPGTSSGASMRAGMTAVGGLQGLLTGGAGQGSTSSAASTGSGNQSQGEAQTNAATANRFGSALSSLGGVGSAMATGLGAVTSIGAAAASAGIDDMNQTGVGDSSYFPDYQRGGQRFNPDQRDPDGDNSDGGNGGSGATRQDSSAGPPPTFPTSGASPGSDAGGSTHGPTAAGSAGGAGAGGSGAAAAGIPPVA